MSHSHYIKSLLDLEDTNIEILEDLLRKNPIQVELARLYQQNFHLSLPLALTVLAKVLL